MNKRQNKKRWVVLSMGKRMPFDEIKFYKKMSRYWKSRAFYKLKFESEWYSRIIRRLTTNDDYIKKTDKGGDE